MDDDLYHTQRQKKIKIQRSSQKNPESDKTFDRNVDGQQPCCNNTYAISDLMICSVNEGVMNILLLDSVAHLSYHENLHKGSG